MFYTERRSPAVTQVLFKGGRDEILFEFKTLTAYKSQSLTSVSTYQIRPHLARNAFIMYMEFLPCMRMTHIEFRKKKG
jgi:hypothetical protein